MNPLNLSGASAMLLHPIEQLNNCHAPSQLDPEEPSHMHIHLMMDCDLTQLRHHHAWAMQNILWLAISDIDRYLQAGRDGTL